MTAENNKARDLQASLMARIKRPTIAQIRSAMINGIGVEVGWTFQGARQTPEQLRMRVAAAGLDQTSVTDIDPVSGIKRAVAEWKVRQGRTVLAKAEIVAVDDNAQEVAIGILYHTRKGDREVAKLQREVLVWSTATNEWTQPGTSDEAIAFRHRVAMRQAFYDGNDVRDKLIMPALRAAQAVPSRRGSYYVADAHLDKLEQLEHALEGLENFRLEPQGVESGQGGDARMGQSAVRAVGDELAKLEEQIEGWIDQPSAVGTNTEKHVMDRFDELSSMARLYESTLKIRLSDLQDLIVDMRETARDRIADKRTQSAAKKSNKLGTVQVDRRAALAAMDEIKLAKLWGFKIGADVEMPTDKDELLDRLMEAMAA